MPIASTGASAVLCSVMWPELSLKLNALISDQAEICFFLIFLILVKITKYILINKSWNLFVWVGLTVDGIFPVFEVFGDAMKKLNTNFGETFNWLTSRLRNNQPSFSATFPISWYKIFWYGHGRNPILTLA